MLFATTNTNPTKDATMRNSSNKALACLVIPILVTLILGAGIASLTAAEKEVPLEFSGGHDIGRNDYGRPVPLIAAALGVKPDDFRQAFSGVTPAKGGPPSGDEAKKNKDALMKVLAPLGVTNDRLDEVSNYYRYMPQRGELWKTTPAKGHALIEDGKANKVVITEPGSDLQLAPQGRDQGNGRDTAEDYAALRQGFPQKRLHPVGRGSGVNEVTEPEPASAGFPLLAPRFIAG
jgi:hypothetical protein